MKLKLFLVVLCVVFITTLMLLLKKRPGESMEWNPIAIPIHFSGMLTNGQRGVVFSFTNTVGFPLETTDYLNTPVEVQCYENHQWQSHFTRSDHSQENHELDVVLGEGESMSWWTTFCPPVPWFVVVEASDARAKALWKGGAPILLVSDVMNGSSVVSTTNELWREAFQVHGTKGDR